MSNIYKLSLIDIKKKIEEKESKGLRRSRNRYYFYCPLCLDFRYLCTSQYTTLIF